MTPFTVETKDITVYPERVINVPAHIVTVDTVKWTTVDDSFSKRLIIRTNGQLAITITDAEYDALGQWSDEDIKALIIAHYGFVEV